MVKDDIYKPSYVHRWNEYCCVIQPSAILPQASQHCEIVHWCLNPLGAETLYTKGSNLENLQSNFTSLEDSWNVYSVKINYVLCIWVTLSMHVYDNVLAFVHMCPHSLIYSYITLLCIIIFIMHCYICICLIFLQVMPSPGSSKVSSAAASDVEMEGSTEQQCALSKTRRKGAPEDHADREWKQQKDSDSAGQYSVLLQKTKLMHWGKHWSAQDKGKVIKLLHSRICQCITQTSIQQLDNIRERISGDCK